MKVFQVGAAAVLLASWFSVPAIANTPVEKRIMTHATAVPEAGGTTVKIAPESYTRLIITNELSGSAAKTPNAPRGKVDRFLSSLDIIFEASLTTEAGRFKDLTPLLYRRFESSRKKGENFTREFTFDDRQFPLFLVTGDPASQIARFTLDARFERKPSTDATGLSLSFLSTALKAVSPSSAVVTSLTTDGADNVASKIDESVGKFFSKSVQEKSRFDIDLYDFKPIVITVFGGETEERSLDPENIIGKWKLSFAPARPSIFSSVPCTSDLSSGTCPDDQKEAAFDDAKQRPNAVLAFALIDKIGNSGTIISYLKQQDWWATDLASLESNQQYGAFCRKIRGAMGEIGLSDTDGKIIAYSVSQSGLINNNAVKTGLENDADCVF